jgi:membrane-bound lytic murein transglycosylase A
VQKRKYKVREARFVKTTYSEILGWQYDNHLVSLNTFANSCKVILKKNDSSNISNLTRLGGKARSWKLICKDLQRRKIKTNLDAKKFFEKWFAPYKVLNFKNRSTGLLTGYYEMEINGSLKKSRRYRHPVYMPPKNLSAHQRQDHFLHSSINNGSLKGRNLELVWVDNLAKLYFMHIQGSGKIKLPNNQLMRVGYAGQNGFDYTSIGPYFKHHNATGINSALDMMHWINKNASSGKKIMEINKSYIFFRKIDGPGPIGAQGIPLVAERSIALDRGIYPYSTPVWIETRLPKTRNYLDRKYRRLFITQDTGGAIKGAVRGDIFFGHGSRAEEIACHMNNKGTMFALFPRDITIPQSYKTR